MSIPGRLRSRLIFCVRGPRRPGKAQPPPGIKVAPYPLSSPGDAALTGPTMYQPVIGTCRPGKAQPPPGEITAQSSISLFAMRLAGLQLLCHFRTDCAPDMSSALCHSWRRERTGGGQSPPPPVPPGSGQQNRRCAVPSTFPCRLRVGPRQRPCKTRPGQPASMRAAPAFRERLSDFEAASTGSFSRASG